MASAAIPTGDLHGRLVERPREAEAAALVVRSWTWTCDGKIHERHRAEFAVDLAVRLDVVGDGMIDDAGGDLARRIEEGIAGRGRPVNFDHDIGAGVGRLAEAQHVLARAVLGAA